MTSLSPDVWATHLRATFRNQLLQKRNEDIGCVFFIGFVSRYKLTPPNETELVAILPPGHQNGTRERVVVTSKSEEKVSCRASPAPCPGVRGQAISPKWHDVCVSARDHAD